LVTDTVCNTVYLDIRGSEETHPTSGEALNFMMTVESEDKVYIQDDFRKTAERARVEIEYNPVGAPTAVIYNQEEA
jgi:hypothetical protein